MCSWSQSQPAGNPLPINRDAFWSNLCTQGFPGGVRGKEPTCQCRRHKRPELEPWVRKIPWRRRRQPTPVFSSAESHRQRSPTGYSPEGHNEFATTEATCGDRPCGREKQNKEKLCELSPLIILAQKPMGHKFSEKTQSSVQFSRSVVSDSLRPHGLQHARLPSNSCPSSR